ncbi:tyrosine-type recombinase/integrase [Pseudomonas sp. dw_358]|uniref:tyrosine-type recombinase/integrase n=1 Tax=Pseudomonas sp. dw_358 TaxID=2720083 RepID=UPI001BD21071|nr:tyrosine-type recombinase/integrase [Pseudomonas sp. dw_358]
MRPRKTENRDLPPGVYRRRRPMKKGPDWVGYYYKNAQGKEIALGTDFDKARIKWAELESTKIPVDLTTMKGIFDRYERDIIPKKAPRTQQDNLGELRQLRPLFDGAPIDSITPSMIARYRDARSAKVRANREIALLSHVFNLAREWGLTEKENPCQGVRKNKETPRDYYANDSVWEAVYKTAKGGLRDAMDLAYLTGQRPADVLSMRQDDIQGGYLLVQQDKTTKRLRIQLTTKGTSNRLGRLIEEMVSRNTQRLSNHLVVTDRGRRMTKPMLRVRWDEARDCARAAALEAGDSTLAVRIAQFQFRDIRPKAASEIKDIEDASALLGHSKGEITKRVYRRIGAVAKPSKE